MATSPNCSTSGPPGSVIVIARMSAKEEERDQGNRNDRDEHDDIDREKTAGEAERVGKAAFQILWVVDAPIRPVVRVHSNDPARHVVIEVREKERTRERADQASDAQRIRIVKHMR